MNRTTASVALTEAHRNIFSIADRASVVLAGLEGTGATVSYGDLAAAIGIDMGSLGKLDGWLVFMSLDSAVEHRGWQNIADQGEPSRFQKAPKVTKYRKPSESPLAQSRRKARAAR